MITHYSVLAVLAMPTKYGAWHCIMQRIRFELRSDAERVVYGWNAENNRPKTTYLVCPATDYCA